MADKRDYYEVLGLDRSAADDQIKKAYRQMAKKYHPDLNPGDKTAETRFKEVSEAYEVLSDKTKKARYDQFGHAGVDPNFGGGTGGGAYNVDFGDLGDLFGGDIFSSFFGGGRRSRNGPRPGDDVTTRVVISFEEAAFGCKKAIDITRIEGCEPCGGSGAQTGSTPKSCPTCGGSGQVKSTQRTPFGVMQTQRACGQCNGSGKIISNPCSVCRGKGKVRRTRKEDIRIPAGIDDGQVFEIPGCGDAGHNGGPPGNLQIVVNVRPHAIFERRGFDVWCDFPLTFTQAALGADVTVPTLDGSVRHSVPEGVQPGDVFKLKDKGIPHISGSGRGAQYVRVTVEVPRSLNEKQKQLLRDFDASVGESNYKKRKGFFEKFKDVLKDG